MKRHLTTIPAACLCAALCCLPAGAANRVPEMEIEVALRPDGSAYVTQTWSAETDEGTEFYLARNDSGYLTITDFSVSDINGPYTFVENWDVNATFAEKANKCGILETDEGVELCWGITQYGQQRYAVEYILHDLVGAYSDADGFNHRFVDDMDTFPTDVVLTICNQDGSPLTDQFCDIWAFGFDGQIQFEDGVIRAWSETPLEQGDYMTIMVSMEQGVLSPRRTVEGSFEAVKELAFEDSDYEGGFDLVSAILSLFSAILILLSVLLVLFVLFLCLCFVYQLIDSFLQMIQVKRRMKRVEYFRDAPNGGNLNATHQLGLCCSLCSKDVVLGAYLLRLISCGCLEPTATGGKPETVSLRLVHPPQGDNRYDDTLYTILEAAADHDGVLQPKELEHYCTQNHTALGAFLESCAQDGKQALLSGGCFKRPDRDGLRALSEQGKKELDEILGLKRFLLDFSLIHERGVRETVIWQDYMVYALLLDIADQVAAQLRRLYPDQLSQVERYESCLRCTRHYNHVMYHAYDQERERLEAKRKGGSGGRASRWGGRGSSGGGRGGTR